MSSHEHDRLWDPAADVGGEHDQLLAQLEHLLAPLQAPAPPVLELPARGASQDQAQRVDAPDARHGRHGLLIALVSLAAVLALWFAWRKQPPPAPTPQLALAAQLDIWQVEQLDGEDHCRAPEEAAQPEELATGSVLEQGASLKLGEGASARLSSGDAQLELHPLSTLNNVGGVLTLLEGRAWVDFPARKTGASWQLSAGPLTLETQAARFMVSVEPGAKLELELVSGQLSLAEPAHTLHAGQQCHARFEEGPLPLLGPLECTK